MPMTRTTKPHQHHTLGEISENKIDQAACDEENKHRLMDDFKEYPEDAALFRFRQFVKTINPEFFGRFPAGKTIH